MEGWNGEDENAVPTVNVFLCCYSRFCMGFKGSYIQKLVWFHCNGQNSRILQTSMDTIYTLFIPLTNQLPDLPSGVLRALDSYPGRFINPLASQANHSCALGFKVPSTILEEDSRIQHLNKSNAVTLVHLLHTILMTLLS